MQKTIGAVLSEYREGAQLTQTELALRLREAGIDVTNRAVSKWETDARRPDAAQLIALCRILNIRDISVFGEGSGDYDRLNAVGRRKVSEYIRVLALSGIYERQEKVVALRKLPVYSIAASAGTGQFLDSSDYELVQVGDEIPVSANFGIRIAGDSMEPRYKDGQIVWVQQQLTLNDGEIGIFLYDGCSYCKQLSKVGETLKLISLNSRYEPIEVDTSYCELRVFGKVVS